MSINPVMINDIKPMTHSRMVASDHPSVLTDIYRDDINLVVWQRELSPSLQRVVSELLSSQWDCKTSITVTPDDAFSCLNEALGSPTKWVELSEYVAECVDMFCCLFDLKYAGLRLTTLSHAMCPRFHVDRVPCRLVTTFQGVATEWLPHSTVDRSKLGAGNQGLADEDSGLFQHPDDVQKLTAGDVALLKGSYWEGNEEAGLVHRSPSMITNEKRLLLTLDLIDD